MAKISEETEQRIIAMRRAGTSAAEIARQLKLDPKTVRRITGPSIPRITSAMRLQIIKMVREGKPRAHIARKLGVSPTRVGRVVRDAKVSILPKKRVDERKPETRKEVQEEKQFKRIDPVAGRVKIRIDHKTEVYARPDRVEEVKRKYNLI